VDNQNPDCLSNLHRKEDSFLVLELVPVVSEIRDQQLPRVSPTRTWLVARL